MNRYLIVYRLSDGSDRTGTDYLWGSDMLTALTIWTGGRHAPPEVIHVVKVGEREAYGA